MSGASIAERVAETRARIEAAARRAGRDPESVQLLAVAKTFPVERILAAARAGLRAFGENRIQEAAAKLPELRARWSEAEPPELHFVGALQRNKARRALELFDVIQSVDRPELAAALSRAAAALDCHRTVLLQVNVDEEPHKAGAPPGGLPALFEAVAALPRLRVAGLMCIPRRRDDAEAQRPAFARLRSLLEELTLQHPGAGLAELSMGMTADYEIAIEEGATCVRLGTAIFGPRARP